MPEDGQDGRIGVHAPRRVAQVHEHAPDSVITRPRSMVEPPVLGMVLRLRTVRMLCAQVSAVSHSGMDFTLHDVWRWYTNPYQTL